jgi:hypothetical protein
MHINHVNAEVSHCSAKMYYFPSVLPLCAPGAYIGITGAVLYEQRHRLSGPEEFMQKTLE